MTKKMTRREALEFAIDNIIANCGDDLAKCKGDEAINVLENMIAQIDKQAARPKSKTAARRQNEELAKVFVELLKNEKEPVNAKWMTYHVKYCLTTQKAVAIAAIAEEWGMIEKVIIKNRTYYQLI